MVGEKEVDMLVILKKEVLGGMILMVGRVFREEVMSSVMSSSCRERIDGWLRSFIVKEEVKGLKGLMGLVEGGGAKSTKG